MKRAEAKKKAKEDKEMRSMAALRKRENGKNEQTCEERESPTGHSPADNGKRRGLLNNAMCDQSERREEEQRECNEMKEAVDGSAEDNSNDLLDQRY